MSREPRMVRARAIIGKTITAFEPNPSRDAARGTFVHQPTITLSDGSRLFFVTEETDGGECYGTFIGRSIANRRSRKQMP